jgi:exonuclease 3'-5' domain-containing protein 1
MDTVPDSVESGAFSSALICDDLASFSKAIEALQLYRYIAFDCEGVCLGTVGGKLSLLTLCGIPASQSDHPPLVYIIDTMAFNDGELQPLFGILRSQEYTKVMFDGRMDWTELFYRHSVEIAHVLDLQLADVDSRKQRGETGRQQRDRLSPYLYRGDVRGDPSRYISVHRLNSLVSCAREHGVIPDSSDLKASKHRTISHHSLAKIQVYWQRAFLTTSGMPVR